MHARLSRLTLFGIATALIAACANTIASTDTMSGATTSTQAGLEAAKKAKPN